ncbi:DNA helicase IV [Actinoalloteichus hoggarensis]|uniref:Helicase IV n=1 Tax=Actinoalloteichus hoggarensis TaxID=1470176 RepID=A0A221W495_9PSEU|nr:ATP-binding domain-containing protein [Actinoalloteichus hoggarensis]ASO20712.1 Helicase IV [Actinoalloteichus hoggarensis]MBB5924434.1 DNA helicase IV [Actinoalloteichus hoggarensis]
MSTFEFEAELAAEREYVASLYEKLDEERRKAEQELERNLRERTATSPQARWQQQASVDHLTTRIHALKVADSGLCFGRIDETDGETTYIGRIGLFDEENDYEPLVIDWRAPASRPFYCATVAKPEGLVRRRHFRSRGHEVVDFHDDVLDLNAAEGGGDADSALLAALNAPREGRMRDIVATIQAEQDEIIRLGHGGVVVIQGGPGTGKTAVALHRVAHLLYNHRDRLARRGVLVVGPNEGFLDYVGNVLPSLGETSVVFATTGMLMPGVVATREDGPDAKRVKGSLAMVDVVKAAVADRQELPDEPIPIELDHVDDLKVDAKLAERARQYTRDAGLLHNDAREVFHQHLVEGLVTRAVNQIGKGWLDKRDTVLRAELAADTTAALKGSDDVVRAVNRLWPFLTPQRLLADLFSDRARLAAAAPNLSEADRESLYREVGDAWTVSDAPLLDEAVEFLGVDHSAEKRAAREREEHVKYTKGVLQVLETDDEMDDETLRASDVVDAETLADRNEERDGRDIATRASADREWTYGHVVVDEAQELSEMDWRILMRRCPTKSMTIVGDLSQRQSAAGARTWGAMLDQYVPQRWMYRELTINYRTPSEIMEVASRVLAELDATLAMPESIRSNGIRPQARETNAAAVAETVAEAVRTSPEEGAAVVIVPEGMTLDLAEFGVDAPVLTPQASKGLEFDLVVVVEPHRILADPLHGAAELYVALTRATQRLVVVHSEPLPAVLDGLESAVAETR